MKHSALWVPSNVNFRLYENIFDQTFNRRCEEIAPQFAALKDLIDKTVERECGQEHSSLSTYQKRGG